MLIQIAELAPIISHEYALTLSQKIQTNFDMETALLNRISSGDPGVMLVVSAADLRAAVSDMWSAHRQQTAQAIARHREQPTMTRDDAARALNVTLSTLWRWAKIGYLVPVKIGAKVLYRASDIEDILNRKGGEV